MANQQAEDLNFESTVRSMFLRNGADASQPVQDVNSASAGKSKKQRRWQPLDMRSGAVPKSPGSFSQTAQTQQNPPIPPQRTTRAPHHQPSQRPIYSAPAQAPLYPPHHQSLSQLPSVNPDAFQRGQGGQSRQHQQLYHPHSAQSQQSGYIPKSVRPQNASFRPNPYKSSLFEIRNLSTVQYLEDLASSELPLVEMSERERDEKAAFRTALNVVCKDVCASDADYLPRANLEIFGSVGSGFANAGSDMDLVIVLEDHQHPNVQASAATSLLERDFPRALEKRLLNMGFGARLLSKTRVPIIKICQMPDASLLDKLRSEREKWEMLPNEKKYPHLHNEEDEEDEPARNAQPAAVQDLSQAPESLDMSALSISEPGDSSHHQKRAVSHTNRADRVTSSDQIVSAGPKVSDERSQNSPDRREAKTWTRERRAGPLDFPKEGVGIQCDINFCNPLGLHNTHLLYCYSICDPRVRPMVLFVKLWAKRRRINSSYSGTLSSYGYVLMILHYLVHIARPPVLPNLQSPWRPHHNCTPQGHASVQVDGWAIDFWRNDAEIRSAAANGRLTANNESLGALLAGFFHYFSSLGGGRSFHWMKEVICLRLPSGILSKEEKGWVKATTQETEGKRVQNRYLFCIEDPFELTHNVARTVTHPGIVAIRDEFRRAYRILQAVGTNAPPREGGLLDLLRE